ncbi:MAG: hypothetical protein IJI38_08570, partial [Clostridia bacterium]|nr:hypothetical protein [Clostridia bacterium]
RFLSLVTAGVMALASVGSSAECVKHQRVFGVLGPDGQVRTVIDNVFLENRDQADVLMDQTELADIENVTGQQTFTREGSSLTWQADGTNIVYQGRGMNALKVVPRVTITRNGSALTPAEAKNAEGPVNFQISYSGETAAPMLFINLIPLPEGAEVVRFEHATTLVMGNVQMLIGWAVPGMDPAFGMPETFEFTLSLHGAFPESIMTFAGTDILGNMLKKAAVYGEEGKILLTDLNEVLRAWREGQEMPEIQSVQFQALLEEVIGGTGENVNLSEASVQGLTERADEMESRTVEADTISASFAAQTDTIRKTAAEAASSAGALSEEIVSAAGIASAAEKKAAALGKEIAGSRTESGKLKDSIQTLLTSSLELEGTMGGSVKKAGGLKTDAGTLVTTANTAQTAAGTVQTTADSLAGTAATIASDMEKLLSQIVTAVSNGAGNAESTKAVQAAAAGVSTDVNGLSEQSAKVKKGAGNLQTTASNIAEGAKTLASGSKEQDNGFNKLDSGVEKLNKALETLTSGVNSLKVEVTTIQDGITAIDGELAALEGGLEALSGEKDKLTGEAEQMMTSMLAHTWIIVQHDVEPFGMTVAELNKENYGSVLDKLEAAFNDDLIRQLAEERFRKQLREEAADQEPTLRNRTEEGVRKLVLEMVLSRQGLDMTAEEYVDAVSRGKIARKTREGIEAEVTDLMEDEEILASVDEQMESQIEETVSRMLTADPAGKEQMLETVRFEAEAVCAQIRSLKEQLDRTAAFAENLKEYTDRTTAQKAGVQKARASTSELVKTSAALQTAAVSSDTAASAVEKAVGPVAAQIKALKAGSAGVSKQALAVSQSAAQLVTDATALQTSGEELEKGMTGLKKTAAELASSAKSAADSSREADRALKTLQKSAQSLKSGAEAISADGKAAAEQAKTAKAQTDQLLTLGKAVQAALKDLHTTIAAHQTAVHTVNGDLQSIKTESENLEKNITGLEADVKTAAADAGSSAVGIAALQEKA